MITHCVPLRQVIFYKRGQVKNVVYSPTGLVDFKFFSCPVNDNQNVINPQYVFASSIDFIPNLFLFASCRTLLEKQGASDELLATVGDDINVSHRVILLCTV